MALLTCVYPGTGTLSTPAPANSSETINGNDILAGACYTVIAGATPTTVTLVDPGRTAAGTSAGTVAGVTVAANTAKSWGSNVLRNFIDSATNLVTVNLSSTTTITELLIADGD
jgi:hypothetical protein